MIIRTFLSNNKEKERMIKINILKEPPYFLREISKNTYLLNTGSDILTVHFDPSGKDLSSAILSLCTKFDM